MANDYSKLSKEELLKVVEKIESRKKYGLIWDEERTKEQFEKESENALPVLKEVKGKEIKTDPSKPVNILIEGDNYHALSVLNYTHQGRIDVIYIDPPYNTGNKDFVYNDIYVDKQDTYRHSKWISFMEKRLQLAKKLLIEDGAIFISIDDNEYSRLVVLLEGIFGEDNIKTICIKMSEPTGVKMAQVLKSGGIPKVKEYLVIAKKGGIKNIFFPQIPKGKWDDEYKILLDNITREEQIKIKTIRDDEKRTEKDIDMVDAILSKIRFISIEEYFKKKNIKDKREKEKFKYDNAWKIIRTVATTGNAKKIADKKRKSIKGNAFSIITPQKKMYFILKDYNEESSQPRIKILIAEDYLTSHPCDLWTDIKTTGLDAEGGVDFRNGKKPLSLIKRVVNAIVKNNAVVLDFFAGSGTTAEAVLQANKENTSNKSFILCTYNEENNNGKIIDEYCYPRLNNVLNGYGSKEKLEFNLKYYKTAFVKRSIGKDSLKVRITRECTEMLCLREGIFDEVKKTDDYRIFQHDDRIMGVYYSLERAELKSLKKDLDKIKGKRILYCFTLDPLGLDKKDFRDWKGVSLEPIPQKILDIYEGIYEY